ncbi:DUF1501 domain-containing protein [Lignipirellula cremea]|uniref:Sulfatase n=1 Tax=Lignipirellula cremea TaxID=2528010 RepID=A0A518DVR5_9BACT|nr:DUF1501 domain-containing protein [Lignipirellula cremea]QDU95932.1 hypothetical protein Pla8534_37510 [Lignipirellula cremea]
MNNPYACRTSDHEISRRRVLGALAGAGGAIGLGGMLSPAMAAEIKKQDKQVLFIWLDGGISQLESWDPKPKTEFGGPYRSIPTSVPGVHFSELTPLTAARMDRLTVIRTMSTSDPNHSTGVPRIQRGDPKNRGVDYPFLGSALAKLLPWPTNDLPPYMHIKPGRGGFQYQDAGFLGAKYGALALGEGKPPIHLYRPDSISDEADEVRNDLRRFANAQYREQGRRDSSVDAYEYSFKMAEQLMKRKDLFDESTVAPKDVERYGSHPLGRHLLQARRLLEAGVQFVKVTSYHWDMHGDNFNMHRALVPQIDRPFSAILDDLSDRGMMDRVMVVLMSEFGRTPKINTRIGRDHYPNAWSMVLAGAGIQRGVVVGKTTANGVACDDSQYDVGHLYHTIFQALGINSKTTEYMNNGQPLPIAHDDYSPIQEVLA